jgi:hypothetical protein
MGAKRATLAAAAALAVAFGACATKPATVIDRGSSAPGTKITRKGQELALTGTPIAVGLPLPATTLMDAKTLETVDLSGERGKVLFLSVILSVDTAV